MPPEDAPLTLESALSFLTSNDEKDKGDATAADVSDTAADTDGNAPPSGDASAGADDISAAADDSSTDTQDTPADQGETHDDVDDQGVALPPIEAPSSWKTEEKEVWSSLPRKAQEAILRREQDRTNELRNLQNREAEQRKAAETEVTRLKGLAAQVEVVLNEKVRDLARDFPEIKSDADVVALAQSDPARYAAFQARLLQLNSVAQARAEAAREVAKAATKTDAETLAKAKDALLEAFPTWKDPEVARREATELQDYAIKMGAPETAARATIDPLIYKLAHKAMLYDRAQAAKASAVKRDPPRVVKPGAQSANSRTTAKEATRRSLMEQLDKTGDMDLAVKLLLT